MDSPRRQLQQTQQKEQLEKQTQKEHQEDMVVTNGMDIPRRDEFDAVKAMAAKASLTAASGAPRHS